jgi:pimeloyl-ACP methyl ester carboxylesterase
VPHAELIVVPGVGHLVQNAATEQIIAAIESLIPKAALEATASAVR